MTLDEPKRKLRTVASSMEVKKRTKDPKLSKYNNLGLSSALFNTLTVHSRNLISLQNEKRGRNIHLNKSVTIDKNRMNEFADEM